MNFGNRSYNPVQMDGYKHAMEPEAYGMKVDSGQDLNLGVNEIGMSVPMGIAAQNVAGIYSKIRMGAGKLEIQFPGYRSGNRNQQTPEMYGEDQRQAIREMQLANEVRFTTHASFGLMGFMGRDERGNFSVYGANQDLQELKRAIDFQADIGGGGSVVMHSGEFDRPISEMHLDDETHRFNLARDPSGRLLVRQSHTQEFDAQFDLLDSRTSQKMETVQKDRLVATPVWKKAEKDGWGTDIEGKRTFIKKGDYVDYDERQIPIKEWYDPVKGRVPIYDEKSGQFKVEMKHFDYFAKEAEERNNHFKIIRRREPNYYEKLYPEEAFLRATLETQEATSRGWGVYYGRGTDEAIKEIRKIDNAIAFYEKLDKNMPEKEKWKLMKQTGSRYVSSDLMPPEMKSPVEILEKAKREAEENLLYSRQSAMSQFLQAQDTAETKENLITPIKRLEVSGTRMYAEAGIHAMRKSKNEENPVTVAIENLFPERFGGHLEELKWIIQKSREKMVEMLTEPKIHLGVSRNPIEMNQDKLNKAFPGADRGKDMMQENPYYKGISKEEAEELARKHIRATLDTGHLNMWRKYWQEDPKLTKEQNDAKFKDWYLKQVESLAKADMVGNVHLADNFGYQDDHTSPGQGNAPIKEAVAILKKYGYDNAITVEPGADASTDISDFHGLMKTWRLFGGDVYGMGSGGASNPQRWGDVQNSYFGQTNPPYFVFGAYAPSNDWTLWSAVPME